MTTNERRNSTCDARDITSEHIAVFVGSDDDLVARVGPQVASAIDRGDTVLVALERARWAPIEAALGPAASAVTFVEAGDRYATPAAAMSQLHAFARSALERDVPRVSSIGEIGFGTDPADDAEWLRYEAAVNEVFADVPLTAVCIYDERVVPEHVLAGARATHPTVIDHRGRRPSEGYEPRELCQRLPVRTLAPSRSADVTLTDIHDSRQARRELVGAVGPDGPPDLELVVSELLTNALLHGSSPPSVAMWLQPDAVVVRVRDGGRGIVDPFVGLRPPSFPEQGAGLWIANQLARDLSIGPAPDGGAEVTVVIDRGPRRD